LLQPFICNSSLKIRWQELQDTPDKSPRSSIVLRRSSKISSRIIAMFSSVRKVECRPERRWSASDNSPFLKREKPLVDLRFPQCSFLVSCFKTLQLFPLPFSLTENRISQPHVVPTFQPSQKSTNKREALNKKKLLHGTTSSLDAASLQTNAEGSPQEVPSSGSMYYNGPAHQRTFPVSFGSPHV